MSKFLIILNIALGFSLIFSVQESTSSVSPNKQGHVLQMQLKQNIGWKERLGFKGEEERLTVSLSSNVVIKDIELNFILVKNTEIVTSNIPDKFDLIPVIPGKVWEFEVLIKRNKNPHLILRAFGLLPDQQDTKVYLGQTHFYRR